MNIDPQKFFIGLMDFFSILLPGAVLTFLFMDQIGPTVLGNRYPLRDAGQAWAVFLFASYLSGHLVFLLGSWLDHVIYDPIRAWTLPRQIQHVARTGQLVNWPVRACVALLFKRERNTALERVLEIRRQALAQLNAEEALNAFQWSKALLNLKSVENLAVVQRFEADSKFFRCFTVVLLALLVFWPFDAQSRLGGTVVVLGLLALSLWRYMEQRYKAINQAYFSVITVFANDGKLALERPRSSEDQAARAAGAVFREHRNSIEYLLLRENEETNSWVLPSGSVEEGEDHRETAVREVLDRSGVWARITTSLDNVPISVNGGNIDTRLFLMEPIGRGPRKDKQRRHKWVAFPEGLEEANSPETRVLLEHAENLRNPDSTGGNGLPEDRNVGSPTSNEPL
jgi:hypothetical protein